MTGLASVACAEPWIDTSNLALRVEIQHLADQGLITAPVTTFPLLWDAIAENLSEVDIDRLDVVTRSAYFNVMRQHDSANRYSSSVKLNASNTDNRFTSFGDDFRDKNSVAFNFTATGNHWAVRLSPGYVHDPDDDDHLRLDNSYVAGFVANWVLSIGLQDRWWAPGWDTNLSMTNSARPMPGIALTRKNSKPFRLIFTDDYQIPWTVTTFMSHMGDDRTIANALLWGFRLNFKPHKRLEIGLSRLAQWAGDGRPSGPGTFWDLLLGRDNCGVNGLDCDNNQEPGNQQAGYDIRLSLPFFGHNVGFYWQSFAEDGSSRSTKLLTKASTQAGIDTAVTLLGTPARMFVEYTDSLIFCGEGRERGIGDCYYEHHIYNTGLRFNGRVLGDTYDNDAVSLVFGVMTQTHDDASWQSSLRYVELNRDNSDRYPGAPNGNTITEISEDMWMLSGKYRRNFGRFEITLGGSASRSGFKERKHDSDLAAFIDLEFFL